MSDSFFDTIVGLASETHRTGTLYNHNLAGT